MVLEDRLKIAIARRASDVFLRTELARLGSEAQLGRALRKLLDSGVIVKLGMACMQKPSVVSCQAYRSRFSPLRF